MRRSCAALRSGQRRGERGSQLLEFAIAAPMLLLLVVGIWDYGAAFALKQKLTNAAREGARIVSNTPSNTADASGNLCSPAPCNIESGARAVAQYMNQAGLNASCLFTKTPTAAKSGNGWVYSCNGVTLEIDRGNVSSTPLLQPYVAVTTSSGTTNVALTAVTVTYPVTWTAGQLVPPPLPPQVTSEVKMQSLIP